MYKRQSQYYTAPFDTSVSTKDQVYDEETGETWYDYLMGAALDSLTHDTAPVSYTHLDVYKRQPATRTIFFLSSSFWTRSVRMRLIRAAE